MNMRNSHRSSRYGEIVGRDLESSRRSHEINSHWETLRAGIGEIAPKLAEYELQSDEIGERGVTDTYR